MNLGVSPILHGAKVKVVLNDRVVGIFTNVSYSKSYGMHTAHVLGRHSPAAFTYTHQEAIPVTMTGFRVVDAGPYKLNAMPELEDLLSASGVNLQLEDRTDPANPKIIMRGRLYATSFSGGTAARSISDITVQGLMATMDDETSQDAEAPGAVKIDDGI